MSSTNGIAAVLPNVLTKSVNNLEKTELANALMPTESIASNYGVWIVLGGVALIAIVIAIGVAVYQHTKSLADSPWWSDRIRASTDDWGLFRQQGAATDEGRAPPPMSHDAEEKAERKVLKAKAHIPESWCFVGEDLKGRWCVKVPSRDACDSNRVFGSRSDCELVSANALPSGVLHATATSMTPLSTRPIAGR